MNDNSYFCLSEFSSDKEIIKEMRKSTRRKYIPNRVFKENPDITSVYIYGCLIE